MTEEHNNLVPVFMLERICEQPYLSLDLRMMAKRGEITISISKDRAGDLRALDTTTVQSLIDKCTITLKPTSDETAWQFVGGYDAFMHKYGLRPKA